MPVSRVSAAALLLCLSATHARAAVNHEQEIDRIFEPFAGNRSPGCAVAVVQQGTQTFHKGYGMADLDHGVPITPETRFHVASVSKQFTAAAIYQLERDGKLRLQDSVTQYWKRSPAAYAPVTIGNLLNHTSGVRDSWQLLILSGWRIYEDPVRPSDVLTLLESQTGLDFPAGSRYSYSNGGYVLLGEVVQSVSGQPLSQYAAEHVFKPLQMNNTFFRTDYRQVVPNQSYGYTRSSDGPWRTSMPNLDVTGATNLMTTVDDLSRWAANMDQPGAAVDGPMLARMATSGTTSSGRKVDYGGGLGISKSHGSTVIQHAGADAGFRAYFLRVPDRQLSIITLCNTDANVRALTYKLLDVYMGAEPAASAETPVVLSEAELRRYEGTFADVKAHRVRRLVYEGNKLRLDVDTTLYALQPLGGNRFRNPNQNTTITVDLDAAGKPARIIEANSVQDSDIYLRTEAAQPGKVPLAVYEGEYFSPELHTTYRISVDGGHLLLIGPKDIREELEATVEDGFNSGLGHLWFQRKTGSIDGFVLNGDRARKIVFVKAMAQCDCGIQSKGSE